MPHEDPGLAYHCCIVFIGFCCLSSSSISLTMAALYMSGERRTYNDQNGALEHNEGEMHLIASAVLDIVGLACDVGLLVAVAKQLPELVLAWVVAAPMRGVGQLAIAVLVCVKYHLRSSMVYIDAVFTGIFLMCLVFFANVCLNYYRMMRAKKRRRARAQARWRAAREGRQATSRADAADTRAGGGSSTTSTWISSDPSGMGPSGAAVPEYGDPSDRTLALTRVREVTA